jgi:patatin-like phospholipase/acyl hydrolase
MRILTFDGGGLRSIFSARIVQRTLLSTPTLLDRTDLLAGTSGGSIVAMALAFGLAPSEIVRLFSERGHEIFKPDDFLDDIEDLWDLGGARYENRGLQRVLKTVFGSATLQDLKRKIAIPSYDLRGQGRAQPVVFHNFSTEHQGLSIVDVVMRSAAAPTYFPVHQKHADGGLFANHPGLKALALARSLLYGGQRLEKIFMLSIGTGRSPLQLTTSKNDLGALDWLRNGITDYLVDGNADSANEDLTAILGPQYHRVQVDLKKPIGLDDLAGISRMLELADTYDGTELRAWLQGFW